MKRRTKFVLLGVAIALTVPALIPASSVYDPSPLLANLTASIGPIGPGPLKNQRPGSLILRNVVLPGTKENISVRIEAGRITSIGANPGEGLQILDGKGRYLIPGLIDSHVHLSMTPGAALRGDAPETSAKLRAWHMRAYLASGVTSIVDPAVDDRIALEIRARLDAGHRGPRYFALGPPVAAKEGYVEDLFPPGFSEKDTDRLGAHLDRLLAMKANGVKVPLEPGMLAPIWKVHGRPMLDAIRNEANKRRLPIYVHALNDSMYQLGLHLLPHAFVHPPETLADTTLQQVIDSRAYVMTTLAVYDVQRLLLAPDAFADPQCRLTIPQIELDTLNNPAMQRRYQIEMIGETLPFIKGRYRDLLGSLLASKKGQALISSMIEPRLKRTTDTLRKMHRAGIKLVLGSDAGNWPIFPFFFHGPTTWREVALLERAGLTPQETLDTATKNAAKMLGVEQDLGSVEVGKQADLLLLDADPLRGLTQALPTLHTVILDGIAHTKEEWMAETLSAHSTQ